MFTEHTQMLITYFNTTILVTVSDLLFYVHIAANLCSSIFMPSTFECACVQTGAVPN